MKANWFFGLFKKREYIPDSATIDRMMNTTRWKNVELESFVRDSYARVKCVWKKCPSHYEVLYCPEEGYILNDIDHETMHSGRFVEGNLKELYNTFN